MNLPERTILVSESFDRAAEDYDRYARIQRRAAKSLAQRILEASPRRTTGRILELGCGTGNLTEHLLPFYRSADWTITDIAPKMVDRCQRRLKEIEEPDRQLATQNGNADHRKQRSHRSDDRGQRDFRIIDARALSVDGPFDLICSNLTFQWFTDLVPLVNGATVRLAPGGSLVFNTLGADSFSYWRSLDTSIGGEPTAPVFPSFSELTARLLDGCCRHGTEDLTMEVESESLDDRHGSFLDFLRQLKIIGAGTPIGKRRPTVSQLRNLIHQSRKLEGEGTSPGISIGYQVVTIIIHRDPC